MNKIYEWKWRAGVVYGIPVITENYHTESEMEGMPFVKIEETKREHK